MSELCVMCGNVLPPESGSQVCRTCELTAGIKFMDFLRCPVCGERLSLWYKHVTRYIPIQYDFFPYLEVDLIYHCDACGCDWDSQYTQEFGDEGQTGLTRHFWG